MPQFFHCETTEKPPHEYDPPPPEVCDPPPPPPEDCDPPPPPPVDCDPPPPEDCDPPPSDPPEYCPPEQPPEEECPPVNDCQDPGPTHSHESGGINILNNVLNGNTLLSGNALLSGNSILNGNTLNVGDVLSPNLNIAPTVDLGGVNVDVGTIAPVLEAVVGNGTLNDLVDVGNIVGNAVNIDVIDNIYSVAAVENVVASVANLDIDDITAVASDLVDVSNVVAQLDVVDNITDLSVASDLVDATALNGIVASVADPDVLDLDGLAIGDIGSELVSALVSLDGGYSSANVTAVVGDVIAQVADVADAGAAIAQLAGNGVGGGLLTGDLDLSDVGAAVNSVDIADLQDLSTLHGLVTEANLFNIDIPGIDLGHDNG